MGAWVRSQSSNWLVFGVNFILKQKMGRMVFLMF